MFLFEFGIWKIFLFNSYTLIHTKKLKKLDCIKNQHNRFLIYAKWILFLVKMKKIKNIFSTWRGNNLISHSQLCFVSVIFYHIINLHAFLLLSLSFTSKYSEKFLFILFFSFYLRIFPNRFQFSQFFLFSCFFFTKIPKARLVNRNKLFNYCMYFLGWPKTPKISSADVYCFLLSKNYFFIRIHESATWKIVRVQGSLKTNWNSSKNFFFCLLIMQWKFSLSPTQHLREKIFIKEILSFVEKFSHEPFWPDFNT